jgi:hypothetical protein
MKIMHHAVWIITVATVSVLVTAGCTAPVAPPSSEPSQGSEERTGKVSSALNPACPGHQVVAASVQNGNQCWGNYAGSMFMFMGHRSDYDLVDLVGWCFNGGEPVNVWITTNENGNQEIVFQQWFTASPDGDVNTWFPGSFSASKAAEAHRGGSGAYTNTIYAVGWYSGIVATNTFTVPAC